MRVEKQAVPELAAPADFAAPVEIWVAQEPVAAAEVAEPAEILAAEID